MVRVLSARFSLELTTQFPFRQCFSPLLDRCPSVTVVQSDAIRRKMAKSSKICLLRREMIACTSSHLACKGALLAEL